MAASFISSRASLIPGQLPSPPMRVFPAGVDDALYSSRPISANEKTPPRLDGVKFGRRRHVANAPPDGSCHDSEALGCHQANISAPAAVNFT